MTANTRMNPQQTVMMVSLGVAYGGAESYYVKLAKILQEQYRLVGVVCSKRLFEEFQGLGIEVRYAGENLSGARRYLESIQSCLELVRQFRPRLAHLNGQPESYLAPFLRLNGLRVLTTRHTPFTGLFLKEGSGLPVFIKRAIVLFCLRCCSGTICVSKLLQSQLRVYLPKTRLPFIPTWIEDRMLTPYARPLPSRPLRALFVGRVVQNKGIFDVIEAIRRCEGVHLTVVGEGPQMGDAMRLAADLPIEFKGFSQDCSAAYRSSDMLIFASPEGFEGLPQVPLEAMAMEVPCLASNISSILEIAEVDLGEQPVLALFRQGDAGDLATQLSRLVADPALLSELGRAGRRQVVNRFTVKAVSRPYLLEFAEALR
jgi:glycosyltransferase involved in cell wall biosynthesis